MATHSSILAQEVPWAEEPSGVCVHGVTKQSDTLVSMYSVVMDRVFEFRGLIFWQVLGAPERKMLSVWHEQSSLQAMFFFFYVTLSLRYSCSADKHSRQAFKLLYSKTNKIYYCGMVLGPLKRKPSNLWAKGNQEAPLVIYGQSTSHFLKKYLTASSLS